MARRGEAWRGRLQRGRLRLNQARAVAERRRSGMFTSLSTGTFFFSEGDLLPRGPLHMITGAWPPFEIAEYFWTKQVLLNWGFQR